MTIKEKLIRKAMELGFVKAGFTSTEDFTDYYKDEHIDKYYTFLKNDPRNIIDTANHLKNNFPEAKSIFVTIHSYGMSEYPAKLTKHIGRAYLGRAYGPKEDTINGQQIKLLKDFIKAQGINIIEKCVVPARAAAARAGCTTFGKNNFAYAGKYGSFIIINTFVLDTEIEPDTPTMMRACPPDCHRCMDACPTRAIEAPGRLCPQKCMGYNNWMNQAEKGNDPFIPDELRSKIGGHIHGCDICQEVCPRNQGVLNSTKKREPFLDYIVERFDLRKILFLENDYYDDVIQPIMYNYIKDFRYFRRNAAIAMGNSGDKSYLPDLKKAAKDTDELVADAANWAIRQLTSR